MKKLNPEFYGEAWMRIIFVFAMTLNIPNDQDEPRKIISDFTEQTG